MRCSQSTSPHKHPMATSADGLVHSRTTHFAFQRVMGTPRTATITFVLRTLHLRLVVPMY